MKLSSSRHFDKAAILEAMEGKYDEFYSQYVKLRRVGRDLRGPCPIHKGDRANFTAYDNGRWYCFSECGRGGDVIDFIQDVEGVDFVGALQTLAEFVRVIS